MTGTGLMTRHRGAGLPRWLLVPGVIVAVLGLVLLTISVVAVPWGMIDLQVYHWGGDTAWHSNNVYDQRDVNDAGLPFTYTPMALMAFMAMALLPVTPLKIVIAVGTVLAQAATVWIALGIAGFRRSAGRVGLTLLLTAVTLWLEPVQQTLGFGQVDVLLMLMVMGDLSLDGRRRGKGVLLGVATGFKLIPGIFIGYLLVTRRFRAAAVSAGTLVATIAAGFVLLPAESRRYWIDGVFADSSRVGGVGYVGNQSLQGLLFRSLKNGVDGTRPYWLAAALVIGVGGLALAAWAARRGEELLGISVAAMAGLLASPISWSHHWVWIAVVLVTVVTFALRYRSILLWAVTVLLTSLFVAYPMAVENLSRRPMGLIWSVPFRDDKELHWDAAQILIGNLYVVAGLVLLVGTAGWMLSSAPGPGQADSTASTPITARR